jgi:outer membrane protein insertion porin family
MHQREENTIPIQILVKEAPRLTMKVGYGYGIEEQIRIYTDILRLGFLGGARRLNLYIKHSKLEPYNLNLKFTQPAFVKPRTTLQLNSFLKSENEPGYDLSRAGGTITLQHQFSSRTNAYVSYILEKDNLEISPETQILDNLTLSYYNKSTTKIGIIRDTSGPIFSPHYGFLAALDYTLSGLDFNSEFDFTKVLFEFRNYQRINRSFVFAYKLKVGVMKPIWGDEVTPIEERFFCGGSNSVRGWQRSQLGPKNADNDPIGGNSLLEGSIEIRYPIWNIFSGAAFLDCGNVWTKSFNYNPDDLHYAAGFGIRANTPIGPIRFDVARPIFDVVKQIQIHLSVGQAF